MKYSLRGAFVLLAAAAVADGACGGNVVVDQPTGGTGGAGGAGGAGGSIPSTTGVGASTTTVGVGGSPTTTTVGAGGSITTTTSTSTTTTSTTITTTTTTTLSGACSAGLDEKIFFSTVVFPVEVQCAMQNFGNPAALQACLTAKLGVSDGCAGCMSNDLQCTINHCLSQCAQSPGSQNCTSCRKTSCEASFVACSGQPHDTGITSCSGVLGNGIGSTPWQHGLLPADFTTAAAEKAYTELETCACTSAPCAALCGGSFCMGQMPTTQCADCIKTSCGMGIADCETN